MNLSDQLAISIVSHNHGRMLRSLLQDLSVLPSTAGVRIIVTLNLPGEAFEPAEFPGLEIQVIRNFSPKGFGANHNAAFQHADVRFKWFVILNPDLRMPEDPFPVLLSTADQHPAVKVLAPQIQSPHGLPEDAVRSNLSLPSLIARTLGNRHRTVTSGPALAGSSFYWLAGMFLMVNAEAYSKVQGFDERFFMYCEDYDLCARVYNSGLGLLSVTDCKVIHDAQRDSHRSRAHFKWHMRSLLRVWSSAPFWTICLGLSRRIRLG